MIFDVAPLAAACSGAMALEPSGPCEVGIERTGILREGIVDEAR